MKKLLIARPIDKLKMTASRFQFFKKVFPANINATTVNIKMIGNPLATELIPFPNAADASIAIPYTNKNRAKRLVKFLIVSILPNNSEVSLHPNDGG